MENNYNLEKIDNLKNILASIKAFRYRKEISYYDAEIEKRAPKMIGSKEAFFSSLGKKITNGLNNYGYNEFLEKKSKVEFLLNQVSLDNEIYSDEELKEALDKFFINDATGVARLNLAMDVILDNSYKFEVNEYSYSELSEMLHQEKDYMSNVEKAMKEAYTEIALTKSNIKKEAVVVGSILSLVVVAGGVGGLIGATASAAAGLTTLGVGLAEGVSILALGSIVTAGATIGLSYVGLKEAEKARIKNEFQNLTTEEATMSLVKTVLAIIHLRKNLTDENRDLYDSYIDEYLDLKSDVDLNLFMDEYRVEDNKEKNKLFSNADELLKKKLFG